MESPTIRQLEYAIALAEHGHFGRAAEAENVSQPGLSGQIKALEERLGVELFERGPRRTSITPIGEEIVERGRAILRDVQELTMVAAASNRTMTGPVRIGAIPTIAPYLLPTVVQLLLGAWPDAHLELEEQPTAQLVDAIEAGTTDIGILATPYGTGSLHVEDLAKDPFHLAVPVDHELASSTPLPLEKIRGLEMLLLPDQHCLRDHALSACELAGRVEHREVLRASLATLTQMVAGGVGATLLPASAIAIEARDGCGVVARPFVDPSPGRTIAMAWRTSDPRGTHYRDILTPLKKNIRYLIEGQVPTKDATDGA